MNSLATPTQTLAYTYDGSLLKTETLSGTISGTISRDYDNNFRTTQISVNGDAVSLGYDNDDLLTSAGSMTFSRDSQNGLLTGTTLGGATTAHTYNAFGELATFTAKHNADTLLATTYTYDTLGRIATKTETIGGTSSNFVYGYDLAGRLATVTKNGVQTESYTYDANGNRLSENGVAGTYDDQDRLLAYNGNTYTYSANGELQTKTVGPASAGKITTYAYDVYGNLKLVVIPSPLAGEDQGAGATQITYLTDARNRRIGKQVNGTTTQAFLWQDQLRIAAELDASNTVIARFVYGTKVNVPDYMVKNGTTYRIVMDHLGSVKLVINTSNGSVVQRMDYDSYGNVTLDTNPGFQPFGFAGGLYDRDTKLVRFGARDYDAETGRWTQKDPIGFEGGSANVFAYVSNDPINLFDPDGLIEGSPSNVARRQSIGTTAAGYSGSHRWDYSSNNGKQYPANSWKCSGFVCDVLKEAGAGISVSAGGGNRCPTAGELANKGWNPKDWRTLKPGESPEPGDVAAYKIDRAFDADGEIYTGHTGIVTEGGISAAHANGVSIGPMSSGGRDITYRRYTGE